MLGATGRACQSIKTGEDGRHHLMGSVSAEGGTLFQAAHDIVVVAVPWEEALIVGKGFQEHMVPRAMHQTVATFVEGTLRNSFFRADGSDSPVPVRCPHP